MFSKMLRTPTEEIMPYRIRETPPMVAAGMQEMSAANFGQKEKMMARTAARRITSGSKTLVSARTPVFSP